MKPPTTVKGCRSVMGMVNFLSLFCPELQKLLKLIYYLTRKGKQFIWEEEQQIAFKEIKSRLIKLPLLHLPDNKGIFHLYSDTGNFAILLVWKFQHMWILFIGLLLNQLKYLYRKFLESLWTKMLTLTQIWKKILLIKKVLY